MRVFILTNEMPYEYNNILGVFDDATTAMNSPEAETAIPVESRLEWEVLPDGSYRCGSVTPSRMGGSLEYLNITWFDVQSAT